MPLRVKQNGFDLFIYDDLLQGNVNTDTTSPVLLREDNQGCIALAESFMVNKRSKNIRIRFHYLRQQVRDGVIKLKYIGTYDNIADLFTKNLASNTFGRHRDKLVVNPILE